MSQQGSTGYDGDVAPAAVWEDLASSPEAALIDVRTTAERTFVGAPDLSGLGKPTVFVAWTEFPPGTPLDDFAVRLREELDLHDIAADARLYFLCRSGQRSRSAAIAATAAGFAHCFNILDGFEGPLGQDGHRATGASWKAAGLPWRQS